MLQLAGLRCCTSALLSDCPGQCCKCLSNAATTNTLSYGFLPGEQVRSADSRNNMLLSYMHWKKSDIRRDKGKCMCQLYAADEPE